MEKIFKSVGLLFLFATLPVAAQWRKLASPFANIRCTQFPGTAMVNPVGFAVGTRGRIYKTIDTGHSWAYIPYVETLDHQAVAFRDTLLGIVGGDGGYLIRTADGGHTWQTIISCCNSTTIEQILWVNATTVYAVRADGKLHRSYNEGQTFGPAEDLGGGGVRKLFLMPTGRLFMEMKNWEFRYSNDSGINWSSKAFPGNPPTYLWQTSFLPISDSCLLLLVYTGGSPSTNNVRISKNLGVTWTNRSSFNAYSFQDIVSFQNGRTIAFRTVESLSVSSDTLKNFKQIPCPSFSNGGYYDLACNGRQFIVARSGSYSYDFATGKRIDICLQGYFDSYAYRSLTTVDSTLYCALSGGSVFVFEDHQKQIKSVMVRQSVLGGGNLNSNKAGLVSYSFDVDNMGTRQVLAYSQNKFNTVSFLDSALSLWASRIPDGSFLISKYYINDFTNRFKVIKSSLADSCELSFLSPAKQLAFCSLSKLVAYQESDVYHSQDSGKTWQSSETGTSSLVKAIQFVDSTLGFMLCGGKLFRSVDFGAIWSVCIPTLPALFSASYGLSIVFDSHTHGWYFNGDNVCLETFDAGQTWAVKPLPIPGSVVSVSKDPKKERLYLLNSLGDIYRYDKADTLLDGTPQMNYEGAIDLLLFPNPSDGALHITRSFNQAEIHIYNLAGKEVGEYQLKFAQPIDVSGYESGVYLYRAVIDGKGYSGKIIRN